MDRGVEALGGDEGGDDGVGEARGAISKNILAATFNNRVIGVAFKKEQAVVKDYLKKLGEEDPEACQKLIDSMTANGSAEVGPLDNGKTYTVTPDMVSYKPTVMKIHEEKFIPSVVEPSFGVGRIMYAILEHSFYVREGEEKRTVMAFKPAVAAVKAAIMPINNSEQFNGLVEELGDKLRYYALAFRTDASSASIGVVATPVLTRWESLSPSPSTSRRSTRTASSSAPSRCVSATP